MTTFDPPRPALHDSPVRVIASSGDAGWADWIRAAIDGAPVPRRALDGTVVVVISADALMDAGWRSTLSHADDVRLVPFVLNDIDAEAVPERLASLHWVRWTDADTSARDLVAAIGFKDDLHAEIQELTERANAWLTSGRERVRLVADPTRVKQLEGLLAASSGAVPFSIEPQVREYVEYSVKESQRKRSRRRARRWIAIIVVVSSISTSIGLFANAIGLRRTNQASGQAATMGAQSDLAAWSALSLASVLIEGTPTQQVAAQGRLATLIGSPWRGPVIVTPDRGVGALEPDIGGGHMLAILQDPRTGTTELVVFRRDNSERVAVLESDRVFGSIDVAAEAVAAAGPDGVVVFDPAPRVVLDEPARDVWMVDAGSIGVLTETEVIFVEDGVVTQRHPYGLDDVVSHRAVLDGLPAVVVADDGVYKLLAPQLDQPVTIPVEPGFRPVAAIDPASGSVYVSGPGQQVWRSDGDESQPTGIPLADSASFMYLTDAGSLVTYSSAYGVRIHDLQSGLLLGHACQTIPTLNYVFVDQAGTYLSCLSGYMNETWTMPTPPSATPIGTAAEEVAVDDLDLDVDALGWQPEFAAASQDGRSLLVAGDQGRVALFDIDRSGTNADYLLAMATSIPDASGVIGASFGEGIGVQSEAGWWRVLDCRGCSDTATLTARTSERLQGCWSGMQLRSINDESRRRLGVVECPR